MYRRLSAKKKAYFCKSITIEMGGVSRYFSKVLGLGVDFTLLNIRVNFGGWGWGSEVDDDLTLLQVSLTVRDEMITYVI